MLNVPLFSVLIPTHNRAHLLTRAIQSVLHQTFSDFEILIVDDASNDATREVVEQLRDPRLRYIRREQQGGAGASRNTGILSAKGQYISLLDDDDEYLPMFLERSYLTSAHTSDSVGLTWCGLRWVRDTSEGEIVLKEEVWNPKYQSREQAYLSFLGHRRIGTNCGLTFRRAVFDSVGLFDEEFRGGAEDTDFLIRFVRYFDFEVIPEVLMKIHLHSEENLRSDLIGRASDYQRIIQKNWEAIEKRSDLWVTLHYKTGWLNYSCGRRSEGRKFLWKAVRKNPFHLKSWILLLLFETLGRLGPRLHKKISSSKAFISSRIGWTQ